jgi:hypothetical protein
MKTFAHTGQKGQSRTVTDGSGQEGAGPQLASRRPAALTEQALDESLNQSAKVQSQLQLQQMFDQGPRVAAQRKLAADLSARGSALEPRPTMQRQEGLEDDDDLVQRQSMTGEEGSPGSLRETASAQQEQATVKPAIQLAKIETNDDATPERKVGGMEGFASHGLTSSVADQVSIKTVQKTGGERHALDTSGVLQRVVAAQIIPSDLDDTVIGEVNIIGRSPAPVGFTGMGSHISMWATLTDQVKSRLEGKSADEGITAIDDLIKEAQDLPGYSHYVDMTSGQQMQQYLAQNLMYEAREKADNASDQAKFLRLQQYITAYLDWRNLIPFTTFQFGPATATEGQKTGLDILRGQQFQNADYEEGDLQSAVMATLDFETIDKAALLTEEEEVRPDTPGMDPEDTYESRMADMIEQHLKIIESTYPKAYEDAGMSEKVLKNWLKKKGVPSKVILEILFDRYGRD